MTLQMKSRGMLIDEYLTACLKAQFTSTSDNERRMEQLRNLIESTYTEEERYLVEPIIIDLAKELRSCWDAQEVIMSYRNADLTQLSREELQELGAAAILAQVTNGRRNALIRMIDTALGDENMPLQKTYMS